MNYAVDQISARYCERVQVLRNFFCQWYACEGRSFPWRDEGVNPFGILVAEILLKQTRAENAARVWPRLMRLHPNAESMAMADPVELFNTISQLGFGNQRTRALIELAEALVHAGEIPADQKELLRLPNVGVYTSHAVACFGFSQMVPTVDTNVLRVISRVFDLDLPTDIRRAPAVWQIAWELLPDRLVREHNYGILDFAAAICKSRSPLCGECPIATVCDYAQHRAI